MNNILFGLMFLAVLSIMAVPLLQQESWAVNSSEDREDENPVASPKSYYDSEKERVVCGVRLC